MYDDVIHLSSRAFTGTHVNFINPLIAITGNPTTTLDATAHNWIIVLEKLFLPTTNGSKKPRWHPCSKSTTTTSENIFELQGPAKPYISLSQCEKSKEQCILIDHIKDGFIANVKININQQILSGGFFRLIFYKRINGIIQENDVASFVFGFKKEHEESREIIARCNIMLSALKNTKISKLIESGGSALPIVSALKTETVVNELQKYSPSTRRFNNKSSESQLEGFDDRTRVALEIMTSLIYNGTERKDRANKVVVRNKKSEKEKNSATTEKKNIDQKKRKFYCLSEEKDNNNNNKTGNEEKTSAKKYKQ